MSAGMVGLLQLLLIQPAMKTLVVGKEKSCQDVPIHANGVATEFLEKFYVPLQKQYREPTYQCELKICLRDRVLSFLSVFHAGN